MNKFFKSILRTIVLFLLNIAITFLLVSCVTDTSEISNHMENRIKKAYFDEYIFPINPSARREDVSYDKFLKRYKDDKYYVYLFVWEIKEDSTEWSFFLNEIEYTFQHEIEFVVYRNSDRSFYTIQKSLDEQLFSREDFEKALIDNSIPFTTE